MSEGDGIQWSYKKNQTSQEEHDMYADDYTQPPSTTVPAYRADEARARIDKANKRLARAGMTEFFTHTEVESTITETTPEGYEVSVPVITFQINRPTICFGGWDFLASVDVIDGGVLVNAVPGVSVSSIPRPEDHRCDHCRTDRARKYTYLLRHSETGEVVQVGKTCLELFLGVRPSALWVLSYGIDDLEFTPGERVHAGMYDDARYVMRDILKAAWVVTAEGENFISKKVARETNATSTDEIVRHVIIGAWTSTREYATYLNTLRTQARNVPEETVDMLIEAAQDVTGDYGENLRAVLSSERIATRHFALLSSVIGVYRRKNAEQAKRRRDPVAAGFVAEIGEKITDVTAVVRVLSDVETAYGFSTLLVAQDSSGHLIKWFGKVPDQVEGVDLEVGHTIVIKTATVKSHEQYGGDDQTRIVRAKLARPATEATSPTAA